MLIGYARVSTADQNLDRQIDALRSAGCERIWSEAASGKKGAARPQWDDCLSHLRKGDVLVVQELSRMGRHVGELAALLENLQTRGVDLRILGLGADTSTPGGRFLFNIIAAVAAMERDLLIERTQSGLAAARARGRTGGRRPSYGQKQADKVRKLYDAGQLTMAEIAGAVGVSVSTAYRLLSTTPSKESAAPAPLPSS